MTDVQLFVLVLVLTCVVTALSWIVLWPKRRSRLEPPKPVPISFKQAQDEVRQRVATYRTRKGGKDAA